MLEMRPQCEGCGAPTPADTSDVLICSYECTFCSACGEDLHRVCPNCGGALVFRPTRV
jgi:uncharacterized protein